MKKGIAILLCLLLTLSIMTGCKTEKVATAALTIGGEDLDNGIYLLYEMQALMEAQAILAGTLHEEAGAVDGATFEETLKSEVEGQPAREWIHQRTLKLCSRYMYLKQTMEQGNLELNEADLAHLETQVEKTWNRFSDSYEANGITKSDYTEIIKNGMREKAVMNAFYTDGTLFTEDTLKEELLKNWANVRYVLVPLTDRSGAALSKEKETEQQKYADVIFRALQEGESFEEVAQGQLREAYRNVGATEEDLANYKDYIFTEFTPIGRETDQQAFTDQIAETEINGLNQFRMDLGIVVYRRLPTFADEKEYEFFKMMMVETDNGATFRAYVQQQADALEIIEHEQAVKALAPDRLQYLNENAVQPQENEQTARAS